MVPGTSGGALGAPARGLRGSVARTACSGPELRGLGVQCEGRVTDQRRKGLEAAGALTGQDGPRVPQSQAGLQGTGPHFGGKGASSSHRSVARCAGRTHVRSSPGQVARGGRDLPQKPVVC